MAASTASIDPGTPRSKHWHANPLATCNYARTCWQFVVDYLHLPQPYFNHNFDLCYCPGCHDGRSDKEIYIRGGSNYFIPKGWMKFSLAIDTARVNAMEAWAKWPVCYHGTTSMSLRGILDTGFLVVPGETLANGEPVCLRDSTDGSRASLRIPNTNINPNMIFTSPSIEYATSSVHAERVIFHGKEFVVALMLRIQPGSFEVGRSTLLELPPGCEKYDVNKIEWFTRRHGVHLLYGVLVKCLSSGLAPLPFTPPQVFTIPEPITNFSMTCPKARLCWTFLSSITGLSPTFFNHQYDWCFCAECNARNRDKVPPFFYRGQGLKKYSRIEGWTRFGLHVNEAGAIAKNLWTDWELCYHATKAESLPGILKTGHLICPGSYLPNGQQLIVRSGHIEGKFPRDTPRERVELFQPNQIFTSPSLLYVGHPAYVETRNRFQGHAMQVVLQLRILPGSYTVGQTTCTNTPTDPCIDANAMEWYTPRYGVHFIYGILVRGIRQ
ncbi:neuralized 4 [Pelomyxa schiedti]|nr:neuralized 4 [Pelomyxa schiedti]